MTQDLIALLRREAEYSGVWFSDKLSEAANLIERQARVIEEAREALEKVKDINVHQTNGHLYPSTESGWEDAFHDAYEVAYNALEDMENPA